MIGPLASYTLDSAANSGWTAGSSTSANNTTLDGATNNKNNVVSSGSAVNSLRFVSLTTTSGGSLSQTVTLSGTNVIASGGILVTSNSQMLIALAPKAARSPSSGAVSPPATAPT